MNRDRKFRWLILAVAAILLLNGCAMLDGLMGKDIELSPDELMYEGVKNMERGRYTAATEAFQTIKDRYPYSKYALEAELKLSDMLFKRELYDEAFNAYDDFEKLHPRNAEIPYVIYQKGMCHLEQVTTIDRDQSHTLKAKEEFNRLLERFPKSPQANRGRKKLRKCYMHLAEYELYVGHFYYKSKKYQAAINRYLHLIENYPDLGQYHEAMIYLNKCREKISDSEPLDRPEKPESWWKRLTPSFLH